MRHGLHGTESGKSQLREWGFRAATEHDIRFSPLNQAHPFPNGIRRRRTGCHDRQAWSLQAESHRDMPGSHIADEHRDKEGTDSCGSFVD